MKAKPTSIIVAGGYLACGLLAFFIIPKYQTEASGIAVPFTTTRVLAIGPLGWLGLSILLGGLTVLKDSRFPVRWLNFSLTVLLVLLVGSISAAVSRIPAWDVFQHKFVSTHQNLVHSSVSTPAQWEEALRQCTDLEEYAARALAMAKSHPGSEIARKQLWWIISYCPETPTCKEAVEIYSRDYTEILHVKCRSVVSAHNAFAGRCLRAISQWSPDRQIRGEATLGRARFRKAVGDDSAAESLYEEVIAQFADVKMWESAATLGELAKEDLQGLQSQDPPRKPLLAGDKLPHFEATTTSGRVLQVPEDYQGKVLLIDFWATWCVPCVKEIPNLVDAYEKYHSEGLEVLSVSLDKTGAGDLVARFAKKHKMSWPQIYDGKYLDTPLARQFGIGSYGSQGIPYALVVDGDTGSILAEGEEARGANLAAVIEKALANKGSASK